MKKGKKKEVKTEQIVKIVTVLVPLFSAFPISHIKALYKIK